MPEKEGLYFVLHELPLGKSLLVLRKGQRSLGELVFKRGQGERLPKVTWIEASGGVGLSSVAFKLVGKMLELEKAQGFCWDKLKGPGKKAVDLFKKRFKGKVRVEAVKNEFGFLRFNQPKAFKASKHPLRRARK